MCFWWYNKKIELSDSSDIMTTAVNKNVKLDTMIDVPNNFVGLVYYSDKYLFTLHSGEHKFQGDTFYKVVEKNARRNKQYKKPLYNFNIHYINMSRQKIDTSIFVKATFKQKEQYNLSAVYEIQDAKKFADEILLTWYKTTNKRTLRIVNSLFAEFAYSFLRKKLKDDKPLSEQLHTFAEKHFKPYGIAICEISLTKLGENVSMFFDTTTPFIDNQSKPVEPNNLPQIEPAKKYCPNCQSAIIDGADFCHKCGYRFRF